MKCYKMRLILWAAIFMGVIIPYQCAAQINVGVYYFPGWSINYANGHAWDPIKKYPEREPYLGWYSEGDITIAQKQLQWMQQYGINFVIYDWYWINKKNGPVFTKAIDAYLSVDQRNPAVKFAIMYANHLDTPSSAIQFDEIVNYWCRNYFREKNYLRINGRPVVYIFAPNLLREYAAKFNSSAKALLIRAKEISRKQIGSEIYFVGSAQALAEDVLQKLPDDGYDALSAYNYQYGLSGKYNNTKSSSSYQELTKGYVETWRWILANSSLNYFIPVTSGWDRRPWGGSIPPSHDNSNSTPTSFAQQLVEARNMIYKYPNKTQKTIVVCCWNEYGEGSYVEPTKFWGFQYLEKIKSVMAESTPRARGIK